MAKKPNISTLIGSWDSASRLNTIFQGILNALDNTVSRDGSTPNTMEADLDLNGNDIINVKEFGVDQLKVDGVRLVDASAVPAWKSAWSTGVTYAPLDIVRNSGSTYICLEGHTAGIFSTDLGQNKWELFAQQGAAGAGTGDMLAANNLSDVANVATARSNLGLGTIATQVADNVNIDGGAIDGAVIGANSAAAGTFTTVNVSSTAPIVNLKDTDTNVTAVISSDNAGSLRLRADDGAQAAASKINMEIDGAKLFTMDDAGNARLGDSTDPTVSFEVAGTDALLLPVGTKAQRPTGVKGYLRFTDETDEPEYYDGTAWKSVGSAGTVGGSANTPTRTWNTAYQNTQNKPILVAIEVNLTNIRDLYLRISADNVTYYDVAGGSTRDIGVHTFNVIVPDNWYVYLFVSSVTGAGTIDQWMEVY